MIAYRDLSIGVRHFAGQAGEFANMRFNPDLTKSRRIAIDTQYGSEKFNIRTAAPGVTITAGVVYVAVFCLGGEVCSYIFIPYT